MSSIAVIPTARPRQRHLRLVPAGRASGPTAPKRTVAQPARTAAGPLRLTRRGRLAVTLVFLGAVLLAAVMFGSRSAATDHAGAPVPTRAVTVQPGDTLWSIASRIADPGQVRERVLQIEELNALPGPALKVGQRLAVPLR